MRNKFAEVLYKFSKSNNKIRVVAADISPAGKLATLSKKYPDRFSSLLDLFFDDPDITDLYQNDGVHYGPKGKRKIARAIAQDLAKKRLL